MSQLEKVATRSKDPHTQFSCIIVGQDNFPKVTGYNSFPAGIDDNVPERLERPEKYMWIEHAERNAIYAAANSGVALKGCRIYQAGLPCMDCGRGIIAVGIKEVIYDAARQTEWEKTTPRYVPDFLRVKTLLAEGGVTVTPFGQCTP